MSRKKRGRESMLALSPVLTCPDTTAGPGREMKSSDPNGMPSAAAVAISESMSNEMRTLISQVRAETAPSSAFVATSGVDDAPGSPSRRHIFAQQPSSPGAKRQHHNHNHHYHRTAAPPEFGSPFKTYVHRRASASSSSSSGRGILSRSGSGRSSPTLQLGRSSPSLVAPVHMRVGAGGISGISGSGRVPAGGVGGRSGAGAGAGVGAGAGAAAAAAAAGAAAGGTFVHQQFARRRSQRLEARTKLIAKLGEAGLTNLGLLLSSSSGR